MATTKKSATRSLRGRVSAVLAVLAVITTAGGVVLMTGATASATPKNTDNVTICHDVQGNGNTGNGYTIETVDPDSIIKVNGHNSHDGDIIPAFDYDYTQGQKHIVGSYPGKNLDKGAWINNACSPPTETPLCPEGSTRAGQPVADQPCSKPDKVVVTTGEGEPDCTTHEVELFETTTTTHYTFVEGAWVAGEPTSDTVSKGFRDTTTQECPAEQQPTSVTPLYPSANPPSCQAAGTLVVPSQPTGVTVSGGGANGAGAGSYTFTYSPASASYVFPTGTETSKTVTVLPKLTGDQCLPDETPALVAPNAPSQTEPTCTAAGSITAPAAQPGVVVAVADLGNGSTQFTSTPAAGFTFGEGNPQSVTKTVTAKPKKSGADCAEVEGTDESAGPSGNDNGNDNGNEPEVEGTSASRGPALVKGTSAAVPNAIDAGLTGAQTDVRLLVGEALVGAGLLFFAASLWSGLGVRRRGGVQA